jgi:hypothetical protein
MSAYPRKIKASRISMMVYCTAAMYAAADSRSISIQTLIRRLLAVISKENLFDQLLPPVRAHSLGAAAVGESTLVIVRCPLLQGAVGPMLLR